MCPSRNKKAAHPERLSWPGSWAEALTRNMQQHFHYGPRSLRQQRFTGFPPPVAAPFAFVTTAWAIAPQRNPCCHRPFDPGHEAYCTIRPYNSPFSAAFTIFLFAYMATSTRRFCAMPAGVLLSAMGWLSPYPMVVIRLPFTPLPVK